MSSFITVVRWPSEHFGQRLALAWFRPLGVGWHKGAAEQAHDVDTLSVLQDAIFCGVYDFVPDFVSTVLDKPQLLQDMVERGPMPCHQALHILKQESAFFFGAATAAMMW